MPPRRRPGPRSTSGRSGAPTSLSVLTGIRPRRTVQGPGAEPDLLRRDQSERDDSKAPPLVLSNHKTQLVKVAQPEGGASGTRGGGRGCTAEVGERSPGTGNRAPSCKDAFYSWHSGVSEVEPVCPVQPWCEICESAAVSETTTPSIPVQWMDSSVSAAGESAAIVLVMPCYIEVVGHGDCTSVR